MLSRILKFNALFLLAMSFVFFSCEKDNLSTTENFVNENEELLAFHGYDNEHGPRGPRHRFNDRCFDLNYPITIAYPDGTTAEAGDMAALRTLLMEWRENNPDATERPTLVFPVDVTLEDGTVVTIEDQADLRALASDCEGPQRPLLRNCFDVVFPVTVSFPDGTTTEFEDAAALRMAIGAWIEANPDATDHPTFVFPIDVELRNGNVITIDDEDEFNMLRRRCRHAISHHGGNPGDGPGPDFGTPCVQLVFPVTVEFPDGTTAEAGDRQALHQIMREWRMNNQGTEERPMIAFPHDVTLEDGSVVTVYSQEDVQALLDDCNP